MDNKKIDQNRLGNPIKRSSEGLIFVLWKNVILAFLVDFSDETTDVEESGTTIFFVVSSGSSPHELDCQPGGSTQDSHASDDESDSVKRGVGRAPAISGEEVDCLGCHRRIRFSGGGEVKRMRSHEKVGFGLINE